MADGQGEVFIKPVCRLHHIRGYRQRRKGPEEKMSNVRRGRLVREDQGNRRSYPVPVLDCTAGKGATEVAGWNVHRHGHRKTTVSRSS